MKKLIILITILTNINASFLSDSDNEVLNEKVFKCVFKAGPVIGNGYNKNVDKARAISFKDCQNKKRINKISKQCFFIKCVRYQ